MKKLFNYFKKFWDFLKKDTWTSFGLTLAIALILVKFLFFPGLSFLTGTSLPLVIVESCSMYHSESGFEKIFSENSLYSDKLINLKDTDSWDFQNGLSKGDVIFVVGARDIGVGDVIIFNGGSKYPLIHRVINSGKTYGTKGDNYKTNANQLSSEKSIDSEDVIGRALFKIPAIGWAKLIFFESSRGNGNRGLCG
jgi:signal peptidase I